MKTNFSGCWHLSVPLFLESSGKSSLWFSPQDLPVLSQLRGLRLQRPEERQPALSTPRGRSLYWLLLLVVLCHGGHLNGGCMLVRPCGSCCGHCHNCAACR